MNASIEIPFAIGESLWWTGNGSHEEMIQCEECAGTKIITVTLGNGESYALDCAACGHAHAPTGFVRKTVREYTPTPFTAGRVDISGDRITYSSAGPDAGCYSSVNASDLARTREECLVLCAAKTSSWLSEEEIRIHNMMLRARKDMAWSVHYWRRQIREKEKELEAARKRLVACNEKAAKRGPCAADKRAEKEGA